MEIGKREQRPRRAAFSWHTYLLTAAQLSGRSGVATSGLYFEALAVLLGAPRRTGENDLRVLLLLLWARIVVDPGIDVQLFASFPTPLIVLLLFLGPSLTPLLILDEPLILIEVALLPTPHAALSIF